MNPAELPLRDIHLPPPPGWWPPAPGWWFLAMLVIASAALGLWWLQRRRRRQRSAVYNARIELQRLQARVGGEDPVQVLQSLSVLLRRLAISLLPRREAAGLTVEAWLRFLDRDMPGEEFSRGDGRILIDAPYRRDVGPEQLDAVLQLCERWITGQGHGRSGHA